ncbi:MAG: hypothetical protein PSV35_08480 [bacterium]|nr:hypothetical protein [bacterium]
MPKYLKMQNDLQRIIKEEAAKDIERYRAEVSQKRAIARQMELDEIGKNSKTRDEHSGREISHWDDALSRAEKAMNSEVMSYNDWRAAMMGLLTLFSSLNKALHHSIDGSIIHPVRSTLMDGLILPLKDALQEKLAGTPEIELPMLQQFVNLNDDGTLDIQLSRTDKVDGMISSSTQRYLDLLKHKQTLEEKNKTKIDPQILNQIAEVDNQLNYLRRNGVHGNTLNMLFEKGVVDWLQENGYKRDPQTKKIMDGSGAILDKATFEVLKNDPDNGLEHYLTEHVDLYIRPSGPR